MANKVRARAESKSLPYNATQQDRDNAFKALMVVFRRKCSEYGISKTFKEHETFEKASVKDRRKRKEASLRRHKEEMMLLSRAKKAQGNERNSK